MLHTPMLFLATARPAAALAFYRDVLELSFVADAPFALLFEVGGYELRIQKVGALTPAPHAVLGWAVDDLAATLSTLVARGVTAVRDPALPQDDDGILWTPDGAGLAWFRDPDGNLLSLAQHPAPP